MNLALPLGRNKMLGWNKQGGGPDSALRPCVCHLCVRGCLLKFHGERDEERYSGKKSFKKGPYGNDDEKNG